VSLGGEQFAASDMTTMCFGKGMPMSVKRLAVLALLCLGLLFCSTHQA
jgi:hypothetical protein